MSTDANTSLIQPRSWFVRFCRSDMNFWQILAAIIYTCTYGVSYTDAMMFGGMHGTIATLIWGSLIIPVTYSIGIDSDSIQWNKWTRLAIVLFAIFAIVNGITQGLRHHLGDVHIATFSITALTAIYPPFFLGRTISRRRRAES